MNRESALREIQNDIAHSLNEQRFCEGEDKAYERGYTAGLQYALSVIQRMT